MPLHPIVVPMRCAGLWVVADSLTSIANGTGPRTLTARCAVNQSNCSAEVSGSSPKMMMNLAPLHAAGAVLGTTSRISRPIPPHEILLPLVSRLLFPTPMDGLRLLLARSWLRIIRCFPVQLLGLPCMVHSRPLGTPRCG